MVLEATTVEVEALSNNGVGGMRAATIGVEEATIADMDSAALRGDSAAIKTSGLSTSGWL